MPTQLKSFVQRGLRPADRLLSRLWYPQKFALIGLVLVVPLAWVAFSYIGVQSSNTSFAAKEQAGVRYLRPVTGLLASVVAARTVAVRAAGDPAAAGQIQAARAAVTAAVSRVDAAGADGGALGLTAQWGTLRREVAAAVAAPLGTPAAEFARYSALSAGVQALIASDGNNSNMILDPDSDSYYLMDAVLNRIPALMDASGQAADLPAVLAAGGTTFAERLQLEDLKGSTAITQTTGADPDYASALHNTHDGAMAGQLSGPLAGFDSSIHAVIAQLSTAVSGRFDPARALVVSAAAQSRATALGAATLPVIVHLLDVRTGGFGAATVRTVLIALLGVLIAAYLFGGFYQSVRRSQLTIRKGLWELQEYCMTPLTQGLDAMADGDLTRTLSVGAEAVPEHTRDELNCIVKGTNTIRESIVQAVGSFNASNEKLRALVSDVSASAGKVGAASRDMSQTSQETGRATGEIAHAIGDVAQGAEQQVQMMAEARGAAEEVVAAVADSARSAQESAEVADQVRAAVSEGATAASQADEAMRAVRDSSSEVNAAIDELVGKSEQIGQIVQTITGIAEQTNLLALNAAIEAARAGEQGRGFAVVAEEVRKLAEESQGAAAQITQLIGAIQAETTKTVAVVQSGAQRTEHGATVVQRTREAFGQIDAAVTDMSQRVLQITTIADQAAAGVQRMQNSIDQIAAVAETSSATTEHVSASTEQTSASAQEVAASAHELAGTAGALEQLVGQFRVTAQQ